MFCNTQSPFSALFKGLWYRISMRVVASAGEFIIEKAYRVFMLRLPFFSSLFLSRSVLCSSFELSEMCDTSRSNSTSTNVTGHRQVLGMCQFPRSARIIFRANATIPYRFCSPNLSETRSLVILISRWLVMLWNLNT